MFNTPIQKCIMNLLVSFYKKSFLVIANISHTHYVRKHEDNIP
jgi:hypothetical protein